MNYLHQFNDPCLSAVCSPVEPGDDLSFMLDMRRICREANGVGIAAPQIGVLKRVIYIWPMQKGGESLFLINPEISQRSVDEYHDEEGCLSYPGITTYVARHRLVMVNYLTENLKPAVRIFSNFPARVVQHELDHLDGICHVGAIWRSSQAVPSL